MIDRIVSFFTVILQLAFGLGILCLLAYACLALYLIWWCREPIIDFFIDALAVVTLAIWYPLKPIMWGGKWVLNRSRFDCEPNQTEKYNGYLDHIRRLTLERDEFKKEKIWAESALLNARKRHDKIKADLQSSKQTNDNLSRRLKQIELKKFTSKAITEQFIALQKHQLSDLQRSDLYAIFEEAFRMAKELRLKQIAAEKERLEHERREKLRKKPRPVTVRNFKDPSVTRLYMMFQDCFPHGGGFTCQGEWVDEKLTAKAREVLEPCFEGEPTLKPLSTKIVKLIHADAGDPRLSVEERTRMFQLFYEPNIQIRKSTSRQEEKICL